MELLTTHFLSPIGCIEISGSDLGLQSVKVVSKTPCPTGPIPPALKACVVQLNQYFKRERQTFDLQLNLNQSTPFNQQVWQELLKIPYGHTTSYSTIAHQIDNPKAVRAVGTASSLNPFAIIVPCHRVIAKNGDLQGYFYGLDIKRQLLEIENPMSFSRQASLF